MCAFSKHLLHQAHCYCYHRARFAQKVVSLSSLKHDLSTPPASVTQLNLSRKWKYRIPWQRTWQFARKIQIMNSNSISSTLWYDDSFQKNCQISIQLERLFIKVWISLFTAESVSGLLPKWGSAPALQRAATHSLWLFSAALNRGDLFQVFNRFTSALAAKRTGTAAGFQMAAQCRGEHCMKSRALIEAPASIKALKPEPDLSNRAARWRAVRWVGNCEGEWEVIRRAVKIMSSLRLI